MQMLSTVLEVSAKGEEERKIIGSWGFDTDIFAYSGEISPYLFDSFYHFVKKNKKHDNILLILTTPGGSADSAYRISQFLRRTYKGFTIAIASHCKSAGTLLALGATEICMTHSGELGPLDVQIFTPDEFIQRSSGVTVSQALEYLEDRLFSTWEKFFLRIRSSSGGVITTKTAADIAKDLVSTLYCPISGKIDPNYLGDMQRSVDIAYHYGIRLGASHKVVHRLIHNYPSHGFVIGREEASVLFENVKVRDFTPFEMNILSFAGKICESQFSKNPISNLDGEEDYLLYIEIQTEQKNATSRQKAGSRSRSTSTPPRSTEREKRRSSAKPQKEPQKGVKG